MRIGQIVPSSNTTMESELPEVLGAPATGGAGEFTFHSSRARMRSVTSEVLLAMDEDAERCTRELVDADVDVLTSACLVAVMARGPGYHRAFESKIEQWAQQEGLSVPVISSAGALVTCLDLLGARKIAFIAPWLNELAQAARAYIEAEDIEVTSWHALEIADNVEVGRRDPLALVVDVDCIDTTNIDVLVLSACVQMPSLAAIEIVEDAIQRPVVSALTCTAHQILRRLGVVRTVHGAGALLSGAY